MTTLHIEFHPSTEQPPLTVELGYGGWTFREGTIRFFVEDEAHYIPLASVFRFTEKLETTVSRSKGVLDG